MNQMISDLKQNKKIVFVCGSRERGNDMLLTVIKEIPTLKYKFYHTYNKLELKKALETAQILKHINEKIDDLQDSNSHSYLLGDFNHPFYYKDNVMTPYLQLCQGGGEAITPELFTPIEEGHRLILKEFADVHNLAALDLHLINIYNKISSYKNNFKIHYHQDMTTKSFGAMEKHRPYSLINAQIEKGADKSRTYGTDFIGKIIIKSHESVYEKPYEKFTLPKIAPEFIDDDYMFPFFNYEKTTLAERLARFEHTGGFSGGNRSRKRYRYRKRNSKKRVSRKLRKSRKPRRNNRKRISRKTRKH